MGARNAKCLTCGWLYPVEDTTSPEDWVNHGDARVDAESVETCPDPSMVWEDEE